MTSDSFCYASDVVFALRFAQSDPNRTPTGKPKVSVTFALSSSGLIDVSKAEVRAALFETRHHHFESPHHHHHQP